MKHTTIDCYGTNKYLLDDIKFINQLLNDLVYKLELAPIAPPTIIPYYYGKVKEDIGISAILLLEGGHVTIHTFPKRECYFIDCFTPDDFDENFLYEYLYKSLPFDKELTIFNTVLRESNKFEIQEYNPENDFGPHLMLEIDSNYMDMEKMYGFLEGIVYEINMDPITRPLVFKSTRNNPKYLSGIIVIAQSHIALHYEYETKKIFADIFSCMPFDYSVVSGIMATLGNVLSNVLIPRGTKHIVKAKADADMDDNISSGRWQVVSNR
jgi:S-adenosylmethionine/arginine decarboxylase-like enzyme